MMILAIDTAGPNCAVALALQRHGSLDLLARAEERIGTGHAERLMPMIESVLADASVSWADLARIAVTTGPGSFTGVRIGIAAARGLALALAVPAIGVGVLDAMIREVREGGEAPAAARIVACLDARREEIYAQIEGESDPERTDAASLARRAASLGAAIVLAGSAADAVAAEPAMAGLGPAIASRRDHPDIAVVAALGAGAQAGGAPRPLYLRPPDAKPQAGKAIARR